MGGNDMGTSPVESPDSNVLVMLLPASKVRWGKDWGRSSEGSMEAMLNGLNFTDYSNHDDKSRGEIPSDSAVQDDMWVEIGCSVFRAHLVRNVTLTS
jgi:hypothetical protein